MRGNGRETVLFIYKQSPLIVFIDYASWQDFLREVICFMLKKKKKKKKGKGKKKAPALNNI